jgi:hypothetical protein
MVHTFGIVEHMSLSLSLAMITATMHTISGCDTVSPLNFVYKKTAWEVWKSLLEINEVFQWLSATPDEVTEVDLKELKRKAVLLFSRMSQLTE